jgi:23S rRNA (pseudouridine1915-N3)-methyltransferase
VPKEHLNNNKYKVGSFLVMRDYEDATAKTHPHYAAGDYVESGYYVFEDRSSDKAVNMIVCPDIRIEESTKNSINQVKAVVDELGTSPAYVIMNGDAVNAHLNNDGDIAKCLIKEGQKIEKHLAGYIVVLDRLGEMIDSVAFAKKIENISLSSNIVTFVIGGSYGISENIKRMANYSISFSKMTFPHQLFREMLLEQIYRACTITNNVLYHK